jgi:acyl-CoA thioesterase I
LAYGARTAARNVGLVLLLAMPVQAETVIAALGDSLTQGYGLPQEDGFVPQLQAWLNRHGADARVLNAGVSGDTTAGGLSRVQWTLSGVVDAMIVALGGNDLLRGTDPSTSRANLDGVLDAADAAGVPVLLVGFPAPGNYGPDYKASFDAIYPELATEHGALLFPSFFAALETLGETAARADYMQADGIHPNAAGVAMIVDSLGPAVLDLISRAAD